MKKGPIIGRGRTAEVYTWGETSALKLFYPKFPTGDIIEEMRITQELWEKGLPVIRIGEMVELDDRQGFSCEKIEGNSMLQNILHHPWKLRYFAHQLAELQFHIHQHQLTGLEPLKDRLVRHISRGNMLTVEQKTKIIEHVHNLPEAVAVCHCDFHPDNILLTPQGPIVIDWLMAVSGSPQADVANTSLILQYCTIPGASWAQMLGRTLARRFHQHYLAHYLKLTNSSLKAVRSWYVPLAAARLVENIPLAEQEAFIHLIEEWLGKL